MSDFFTGGTLVHDNGEDVDPGTSILGQEASWTWRPLPKGHETHYVRLLSIEPAQPQDNTLRCSLHLSPMQKAVPYQALSYMWGMQAPTKRISVDGCTMWISPTLKHALRMIREHWDDGRLGLKNGERPKLWVDTICINQSDEIEKSHQVMMMDQIYGNAECVLIWLGSGPWWAMERELWAGNCKDWLKEAITSWSSDFGDVDYLWDSLWFSRRWPVQEFLLQNQRWLLLGPHLSNYSTVNDVGTKGLHGHVFPRSWFDISRNLVGAKNLLQNMILCKETACSDPRDYVYALRSISSDGDQFMVDYRRSTNEVYLSIAMHYARTEWLPLLLLYAGDSGEQDEQGLPSWVPDWRTVRYSKDPRPYKNSEYLLTSELDLEIRLASQIDKTALELNAWLELPRLDAPDTILSGLLDRSSFVCELKRIPKRLEYGLDSPSPDLPTFKLVGATPLLQRPIFGCTSENGTSFELETEDAGSISRSMKWDRIRIV